MTDKPLHTDIAREICEASGVSPGTHGMRENTYCICGFVETKLRELEASTVAKLAARARESLKIEDQRTLLGVQALIEEAVAEVQAALQKKHAREIDLVASNANTLNDRLNAMWRERDEWKARAELNVENFEEYQAWQQEMRDVRALIEAAHANLRDLTVDPNLAAALAAVEHLLERNNVK